MEAPHTHVSLAKTKLMKYPETRRVAFVEKMFGTDVYDAYRWMEDESRDLGKFLSSQKKVTDNFLSQHPNRDAMKKAVKNLCSFTDISCPIRAGSKLIIVKRTGLQDQPVIYVQDGLHGDSRVFIDPNTLAADGTFSISTVTPSYDGQYLAYLQSESGSDWNVAKFKNILTGDPFEDTLSKIKFTNLSWTRDNLGIIYSYYPGSDPSKTSDNQRTVFQEVYYHRLDSTQKEDILLASFPKDPDYMTKNYVTYCGTYLILESGKDYGFNLVYFVDLKKWEKDGKKPAPKLRPIIDTLDAEYKYVTSRDSYVYFRTNQNAPNYRLIAIDVNCPASNCWNEIIPEATGVLENCTAVHEDYVFTCYVLSVHSTLELRSLQDGTLIQKYPLDIGSIVECSGNRWDHAFFFKFTSFDTAGTVYRIDLKEAPMISEEEDVEILSASKKKPSSSCCGCIRRNDSTEDDGRYPMKIFHEVEFTNFKQPKIFTKQEFFTSKDGTRVPLFIAYCAYIKPKQKPCFLEAYGAHGVIFKPYYSPLNTAIMVHLDGIIVIVNTRGGGEYGRKWYDAGRQLNKQRTFDDCQSAAEYLIKQRYTVKTKLVMHGIGCGGMATAVCVNQRPDLFCGAIVNGGILDMIRFDKFTLGYSWVSDFGSPEYKPEFENLVPYSPYHNIVEPLDEDIQYPAVMVMTASCDNRVVPLHSYKYIAELQYTIGYKSFKQTNPFLLRVEEKSGHDEENKPISKRIEEAVDILTFFSFVSAQPFR